MTEEDPLPQFPDLIIHLFLIIQSCSEKLYLKWLRFQHIFLQVGANFIWEAYLKKKSEGRLITFQVNIYFAVAQLIYWANVGRGWTGNLEIRSWCYYPLYHRANLVI